MQISLSIFSISYSSMTAALASSIRSFMYFFIRSFLLSGTFLWRFFCESFFLLWFSSDDMIFKMILTRIYKYLRMTSYNSRNEQNTQRTNWPVQNVSLCICTCIFICYYILFIFRVHFHMERLPCLSGLSALCLRNKEAHEA